MKTNTSSFQHTTPRQTLCVAAACGLLMLAAAQAARAQSINPGIIDPTNTYTSKTCSEWAAAFWQHMMSLPATNSPYHHVPGQPVVPLSTGQSGPVWFLGGDFLGAPPNILTTTVPGGVALYVPITLGEEDNARCDGTPPRSESELRAAAKATEDNAINMSCAIDGRRVVGLDDVMTSPYRVQSTFFNYTSSPTHSLLLDVFGLTCYSNRIGPAYTVDGAVLDHVFLLLAPLSAGRHTINGTWGLPPPINLGGSFTHYLTVQPVALSVSTNDRAGNLLLTWPQTPDTYAVEVTPSLSSPNWQPATNAAVTLSNGLYEAIAPMGTGAQYFRLRLP